MIRSELIQKLADENPHLYQRDVERIVNTVFDEVIEAMASGNRVELRGFGAFSVKKRDARVGRNPRTGEKIHIPASIEALNRQYHHQLYLGTTTTAYPDDQDDLPISLDNQDTSTKKNRKGKWLYFYNKFKLLVPKHAKNIKAQRGDGKRLRVKRRAYNKVFDEVTVQFGRRRLPVDCCAHHDCRARRACR